MRKTAVILSAFTLCLIGSVAQVHAQGPSRGPDPSTVRDADLEKDSVHNLEVAKQYFKLKKAYYAALKRSEEIVAGNPTFAKIDEALYIAGMSNYYLSQNRGKQKTESIPEKQRLTSEQYRGEARQFLSQLVNEHPESEFSKQVESTLRELGGPLPKAIGQ